VDNNYLDLGMNKSGFIHTLPSGRLTSDPLVNIQLITDSDGSFILHRTIVSIESSTDDSNACSISHGAEIVTRAAALGIRGDGYPVDENSGGSFVVDPLPRNHKYRPRRGGVRSALAVAPSDPIRKQTRRTH
jgi:hypothetical protein